MYENENQLKRYSCLQPKKKQPRSVIQHRDIQEEVNKIHEPKAEVTQLTDKDGLDRSYDAENNLSLIDHTVCIPGTKIGRASAWYDDIVKAPSLWNAGLVIGHYIIFGWYANSILYIEI